MSIMTQDNPLISLQGLIKINYVDLEAILRCIMCNINDLGQNQGHKNKGHRGKSRSPGVGGPPPKT